MFAMRKKNQKLIPISLLFFTVTLSCIQACTHPNFQKELLTFINVKIVNQTSHPVKDLVITIPISEIKSKYKDFNENAFTVFDGEKEIPSQTEDINSDDLPDNILILADLLENETKTIAIQHDKFAVIKKEFKKRTHAELAIKKDFILKDGVYTGGKFESVNGIEVPADHFAHDALCKFEGPGWESEKVAYRFYLDSRNRNDLFGKKTNELVLQNVGNNDLVSDSKESYTKMCDWGMDIFKVGESLGIGSIGIWENNKVNTISKTNKIICRVADDGIIKSGILTQYFGWQFNSSRYDVNSLLSINAGSRLTKEEITITGNPQNICTGFAKHADCSLIIDQNKEEWGYIASYGKQSLAGDDLGLVIFYKKSDLIKITEDDASYITILKPMDGKLLYYFANAWENELNGKKTKEEFMNYLDNVVFELNHPVTFEIL